MTKVVIDGPNRIIKVNDRKYRLMKEVVGKDGHTKEFQFKPIPDKVWNGRVDKIAKLLVGRSGLTAVEIVKDALNSLDLVTLNQLDSRLKTKARVKVKEGCLSLVVGKIEVPLIG